MIDLRRSLLVLATVALGGGRLGAQQPAPATPAPPPCTRAELLVPDLFSVRWELLDELKLGGAVPAGPVFLERPSSLSRLPACRERAGAAAWALAPADTARVARFGLWPVTGEFVSNSDYPRDENNGALWAGVGGDVAATAGVWARWRWLSVAVAPRVIYQQNSEFPIVPTTSPGFAAVANPYHVGAIDWPQRMGTEAYWTFDPGQSYVRVDAGYAALGFSTENFTIGPARTYPILMSSTAPGFPHAFLGTSRPIPTPIGPIDVQAVFGRLTESPYYDANPGNDHRVFDALVVGWSPRWIPGLSLGAARVYLETITDSTSYGDILRAFLQVNPLYTGGANRDRGNGLAGLFGRWVLPESGFEVYGEWTREDTPYNLEDLLAEPDWTQAYGIGVQQRAKLGTKELHLRAELVHLGAAAPVRAGKGFFSYYTHGDNESLTNEGQLMGAAIGPGSDAENVGLDLLYGRSLTGLWVQRARYDDDTYYERYARRYAESRHDYEITGGIRQVYGRGPLQLEGALALSRRHNRMFRDLQTGSDTATVDTNVGLNLRASWFPRW